MIPFLLLIHLSRSVDEGPLSKGPALSDCLVDNISVFRVKAFSFLSRRQRQVLLQFLRSQQGSYVAWDHWGLSPTFRYTKRSTACSKVEVTPGI